MLQVSKIIAQGKGLAPVLVKRANTVELDWDVRQKSRFDATDSSGRQLGVFLPRGTVVRGGDVMLVEDGSMVKVIAAAQTVLRITHCSNHGSSFDLLRAAYHLGNRHVAIELKADHLKIEVDHVLAEMLQAMHLIVNQVSETFEPEAGAYSQEVHSHSAPAAAKPAPHVHGPNCNHDHAPAAAAQVTEPVKAAPHVHGPSCNHGHDDHAQSLPVAIQIHKHKPH